MEFISAMLRDQLGPYGPAIGIAAVGLFFVLVLAGFIMSKEEDPLEKLNRREDMARGKGKNLEQAAKLREKARNEKLQRYSNFLEPQDAKEHSDVKMRLLQAGYRGPDAVRYYYLSQMVLGIGGLVAGLLYFLFVVQSADSTTKDMMLWVLIPGGSGYMFPKYWVTRRVEERKEKIQMGFPDALDMLLVCVEAGQSMDQSIIRVAKEIRPSFPPLADEFEIVSLEVKAGKDKTQVFQDMGERCGVQDVSSFVTVLIQSQTFGTSIADALRVYASEMRDKRVMRAEEKANKLPTKMTLTTMMLTVPPLLIILVGPSVVGITEMSGISSRFGQ